MFTRSRPMRVAPDALNTLILALKNRARQLDRQIFGELRHALGDVAIPWGTTGPYSRRSPRIWLAWAVWDENPVPLPAWVQ